jgi:hypothetical protein
MFFAANKMPRISTTAENRMNTCQKRTRTSAAAAPPRAVMIGIHQGQKAANTARNVPASPNPLSFPEPLKPIVWMA